MPFQCSVFSHWLTKPFLSGINSRRSDSANTTAASLNSVTNLDWSFRVSLFPSKMLLNSLGQLSHRFSSLPCSHRQQLSPCNCWHSFVFTPWSRALLEKLTGLQLVKKFSAFYGTRRFITAFTSARHLSLSSASSIQSVPPHPTSWRSIIMLSSHLRLGLPSGILPSGFPTKTLYTSLFSPKRATCPAHPILLDLITRTILGEEYRCYFSLCSFLHPLVTSPLLVGIICEHPNPLPVFSKFSGLQTALPDCMHGSHKYGSLKTIRK